MSNSPSSSVKVISHTRRLVPPMSNARKVPCSSPVGNPMTQHTFMGILESYESRPFCSSPMKWSVISLSLLASTVNNRSRVSISVMRCWGTSAIDPETGQLDLWFFGTLSHPFGMAFAVILVRPSCRALNYLGRNLRLGWGSGDVS